MEKEEFNKNALHYPSIHLKYTFNSEENVFINEDFEEQENQKYFKIKRGGEGNIKTGLYSRKEEIENSFLKDIQKQSKALKPKFQKELKKCLGIDKYQEYHEFIYFYSHRKYEHNRTRYEAFEKIVHLHLLKKKYNIYSKRIPSGNISPNFLNPDDVESILDICNKYFIELYTENEYELDATYLHRGIKKILNSGEYKESNILTSYSFSASLAESFANLTEKSNSSMIGLNAYEAEGRIIGLPFLMNRFKHFHYYSFEVITIPPLTLMHAYRDVVYDEIKDFIVLEEKGRLKDYYISTIQGTTNLSSIWYHQ